MVKFKVREIGCVQRRAGSELKIVHPKSGSPALLFAFLLTCWGVVLSKHPLDHQKYIIVIGSLSLL